MNRATLSRSLPALVIVTVSLGLIVAGVLRFALRKTSPTDGASPARTADVVAESRSSSNVSAQPAGVAGVPAATAPGAPRFSGGPLAGATTLEERWLDDPSTAERPRLARLMRRAQDDRIVRVVEQHVRDATGTLVAIGAEVMRADAVLVAVPRGDTAPALAARLRAAGFVTEGVQPADAVVCVAVDAITLDGVPVTLAKIAASLPGLLAEPDFIRFRSQVKPNDYDATRLWGLEKIEAPAAWTVTTGSTEIVVAVIDSGITTTHADLAANLWVNTGETPGNGRDDDANGYIDDINGWNFAGSNATLADSDGHGTHVAGTIGATGNNGSGIVGVSWNVRIMALRAGSETFADSALLNALRYAITMRQRGVRVVAVNMSLGGTGASATFRQEVALARDAGIVLVAAAGNLGDDMPTADNDLVPIYPASYDVDSVIAVASTHQGDGLSVFSHYGANSVDLAAPGTAIYSTYTGGAYARSSGTSMAAPHVAGAVALVAAANPALSATELRARILGTVDPIPALVGKVATGGRLNLRRAVAPTLVRPRVVITRGGSSIDVAALDRAGLALDLQAVLQPDKGVTPVATLSWTTEDGPGAASFAPTNAAATRATFPSAGRYRLRVTASAGALQEQDELVVAVGPDTSVTTAGLQGWWRFNDTGSTTGDDSGNNRAGSVTGAVRSNTAVLGTSMEFNGSTSRVGFDTPAQSRLSIAGWARASGQNSLTIFPRVMHMREGLLFGGFDTANVDDGNQNTLKFALDNGASDVVWHSPPGTLKIGAWYHVAVSYDPTTSNPAPVFYVDGARQITGTQSSAVSTPSVAAGTGFIGDRGDGARGWLGQLDEIRLYNRVLTDADIAWMAREATVQAVAGGSLAAGASADPYLVPFTFSATPTSLGDPTVLDATWSDVSGNAAFTVASPNSATALFTSPGSHLIRYDATTGDGVHIVRTLAVEVPSVVVQREGYYTGTTSTGGAWTLLVRSDNSATFFSAGARGSFLQDIAIPSWGVFSVADRSGATVTGRILADGTVTGTVVDAASGSATFSGARTSGNFGAADPARDGIYSGWIVDSGVRAAALVERGVLSIVIEEPGSHRAATGSIDTGGSFALVPTAGALFSGTAAAGRLDATVTVPGRSARAAVLFRDGTDPVRQLINISVRGFVGTGDAVLIPGFVVQGGTLPVLVQGVGPGLVPLGVTRTLAQPRIILRDTSREIARNVGWTLGPAPADLLAINQRVGAIALDPARADAALTSALGPGSYTVEVNGADGGTGVALAELYDAAASSGAGELVNISGRAYVGTGDDILIGGFVIRGEAPALVLVRGAGPALQGLGVSGVLARPQLRVYRQQTLLGSGSRWGDGDSPLAVTTAAARVGAFAFVSGSSDAAMLLFLPPGAYTAQVSGADGGTGIALLEIYRVSGM